MRAMAAPKRSLTTLPVPNSFPDLNFAESLPFEKLASPLQRRMTEQAIDSLKQVNAELARVNDDYLKLDAKVKSAESERDAAKEASDRAQAELAALKQANEEQRLKGDANHERQLKDAEKKVADAKENAAAAETKVKALLAEQTTLRETIATLDAEKVSLQKDIQAFVDQAQELYSTYTDWTATRKRLGLD